MAALIPLLPEIVLGSTALVITIGTFVQSMMSKKLKRQVTDLETRLKDLAEQLNKSDTGNSGLKQELQREKQDAYELLKSMKEDLNGLEKAEELKDLTETYLRYCEMYAADPENLTNETKEFQRMLMLQLTRVKNSMGIGVESFPTFKIWADGAVLVMKMLTGLFLRGEIKQSTLQTAHQQFQLHMGSMMSTFHASNALPFRIEEYSAVEDSFNSQMHGLQSYLNRASLASSSPHFAIQAPAPQVVTSISHPGQSDESLQDFNQ